MTTVVVSRTAAAAPVQRSELLVAWRVGHARYAGAPLEAEATVLAELLRARASNLPRAGTVHVSAATALRAALVIDALLRLAAGGGSSG